MPDEIPEDVSELFARLEAGEIQQASRLGQAVGAFYMGALKETEDDYVAKELTEVWVTMTIAASGQGEGPEEDPEDGSSLRDLREGLRWHGLRRLGDLSAGAAASVLGPCTDPQVDRQGDLQVVVNDG